MHITVKVVATDSAVAVLSVAIAVALMCTSLSQHCHYHCCRNAVLVFAVTALCTSVSNCCGIPSVLCSCRILKNVKKSYFRICILKTLQSILEVLKVFTCGTVRVLSLFYAKTILGLHSISRDSNDKGYGGHVGVHNKRM